MGRVVEGEERKRPAPSAVGTLATKPIAHLLVYAMERKLTGSLEFSADREVVATMVVKGGLPTKLRTLVPVAYLGQVLYEHGAIDERQLNASLMDVATRKSLQGRALMESGAISIAALRTALVDQTSRKIRHLFTLPESTQFSFFAETDLLAAYGADDTTPVDPLPTLWRGVRDYPSWTHVKAMLSRVDRVQCMLAPHAKLNRFKLEPDELALAECLRARPMGVHEFSGLGVLVPHTAELLYYCLLITRQVDIAAEPRTSSMPAAAPRPANQVAMSTAPPPSHPTMATHQSGSFERPISFNVKVAAPATQPPGSGGSPAATRASEPLLKNAMPNMPSTMPPGMPTTSTPPPSSARQRGVQSSAPPAKGPLSSLPPIGPLSAPPARYSSPSGPGSVGDGEPSPQVIARRNAILEKAASIQKEDHFEILGISRDATAEEAQRAFFRLAEVWHPDRLPPVLDDLRDTCGLVFSHLSEAHNVLSDDRRRQKYIERRENERAPTMAIASVRPVPGTANLFEGAEVSASRKEWERAEALCERYIEDHPNHAPSLALLAWCRSNLNENPTPEQTREQIKILDRALLVDWEYERGFYWRALLYRRVNDEGQAIKDFRAAATLNPRNIEAAREVRLHDMRRRQTPGYGDSSTRTPTPKGVGKPGDTTDRKKTISGLFNKILKR